MGIGAKLDKLMKQRGTNANELAQKLNVSPQTIYSMIKRDSKKADIDILIRIAKEFGVEAEYFCSDDIPIKSEPDYEDMELLIARNGRKMTKEQKLRLIQLLSEYED